MNNVVTHFAVHLVNAPGFYHLRAVSGWAQMAGVVACRSQAKLTKWRKILLKILGATGIALWLLLLTACGKPDYKSNPRPILHTTISADGQMVATLLNAGTDEQRLRVMRLDKTDGWQDVKAPRFTRTIRFGLKGHELLLTHYLPESKQGRLVKIDLDTLPEVQLQQIFQDDDVAFPSEVGSGQFMVRTCPDKNKPGAHQCRLTGYQWMIVDASGKAFPVEAASEGGWSAPTLIGSGFFWIDEKTTSQTEQHPRILSYALPGGQAPVFPKDFFEKSTVNAVCDRQATRCIREFISNLTTGPSGAYIYDLEVMLGTERCRFDGSAGFSDGLSISPDGKTAVMALAERYDTERKTVVMRFGPSACLPTSVQSINF